MLHNAYQTWLAQAEFRRRRSRFKNFTYGNQWADPSADGLSEYDIISRSGRKPLTNNLIRRLVKTIIGHWRTSQAGNESAYQELDARMLEEFLISGAAVQRVGVDSEGRAVVENVSPDNFFVNSHTDPEGRDVVIAGQLHSLPMAEVMRRFAGGSREKARRIMQWYADGFAQLSAGNTAFSDVSGLSVEFFHAESSSGIPLYRVIEVWTRESKQVYICHDPSAPSSAPFPVATENELNAINRRRARKGMKALASRWTLQTGWYVRFYTPGGRVLAEGFSPYAHRSHPYAFRFYPLTDGEVHPFVEDLIDQQQYINRLIVSIDHTMQTSAKGVLLFPVNQLAPGMTMKDVAQRWTQPEGLIPISGNGAVMPQQVVSSAKDSSAYQLLDLQMKLFEQVSGVSEALLGRPASTAAGAEVYKAQVENSTACLRDIIATFTSVLRRRDGMIAEDA